MAQALAQAVWQLEEHDRQHGPKGHGPWRKLKCLCRWSWQVCKYMEMYTAINFGNQLHWAAAAHGKQQMQHEQKRHQMDQKVLQSSDVLLRIRWHCQTSLLQAPCMVTVSHLLHTVSSESIPINQLILKPLKLRMWTAAQSQKSSPAKRGHCAIEWSWQEEEQNHTRKCEELAVCQEGHCVPQWPWHWGSDLHEKVWRARLVPRRSLRTPVTLALRKRITQESVKRFFPGWLEPLPTPTPSLCAPPQPPNKAL